MISSTPEPNPATRSSDHSRFYRRLSHLHESQTKNPPHPRRSRRLKLLFRAAGLLLLFLVVCILVFAFSLRRSMRAALPQLDGSITVAGLSAPVTITRDPQGVPSITAANLDDLLFSQGYITASDRLFQMDALRRHAAGTLAEILGPNLVSHDRYQRTLQISAAADRALATLPPDQLHQLSAYAAGVNAFIASHSSTLPVEFHLLRYTPAPWSPRDTLLVVLAMAQDLSTEFPQKLNREELSTHLPANLLPDLYPSGSWRDIPPGDPGPDLTGTKDAIPQIPLDKSQSRLNQPRLNLPSATPANLLSVFTALSHANCDNCRSGSNNWAVSATHSATGGPLLSNDMHLGLMVPSTWYEASLHTNATGPTASPLNVTGFTLPGVPFVIVGRNAHVAWGFTAALADVQDVRIEHLRGSGNDQQFELPNGSWAPVQHHLETIHVRFGLDKTLDVLTTTHTVGSAAAGSISTIQTPLINPIYPTEHRALSLAWNIYDPATIAIPGLAIDSATNGASLVAAFATFGTPALNLVYADDANHIGYHLIGRIPVRGPAIQRPRATPQFILPDANPDDDDQNPDDPNQTNPDNPSDNTPTSPNASLTLPFASAQLLSAAYVRPSHHARPAHTSHPRRAAAKPKLPLAPKKSMPPPPTPRPANPRPRARHPLHHRLAYLPHPRRLPRRLAGLVRLYPLRRAPFLHRPRLRHPRHRQRPRHHRQLPLLHRQRLGRPLPPRPHPPPALHRLQPHSLRPPRPPERHPLRARPPRRPAHSLRPRPHRGLPQRQVPRRQTPPPGRRHPPLLGRQPLRQLHRRCHRHRHPLRALAHPPLRPTLCSRPRHLRPSSRPRRPHPPLHLERAHLRLGAAPRTHPRPLATPQLPLLGRPSHLRRRPGPPAPPRPLRPHPPHLRRHSSR
jgi:acyl-homoserine lactone acylase PvdQ